MCFRYPLIIINYYYTHCVITYYYVYLYIIFCVKR